MSLLVSSGWAWACMAVAMMLLWLLQLRTADASTVDVAWALGTGAIGVALVAVASEGNPSRRVLAAAMVLAWSVRLGAHLWRRILSSGVEDGRYRYMRKSLGPAAGIGMFVFFQVQALWAVMFAMPVWAAGEAERALDWLDALGVAVWAAGVLGESVADRQLASFRADSAGSRAVCDTGLWGWSRHPNYFFGWLQWWGYVALGAGSEVWWITVAAALLMYVFLTGLTGIPQSERQALRSRGEAYRAYRERVPAFFPRPPNKG